jgi:hypothetical protein
MLLTPLPTPGPVPYPPETDSPVSMPTASAAQRNVSYGRPPDLSWLQEFSSALYGLPYSGLFVGASPEPAPE